MPLIRNYKNGTWQTFEVNDDMPTLSPKQIEERFYQYLEEYSLETYPSEHRAHLGASVIGDECSRKLWYGFRWVKLIQFEGRMRRLFNRGHREEAQLESFLLWAGVKIRSTNPETDKQYVFSKIEGHYGGSTDGLGLIGWIDDFPIIVEFKTHNTKWFTHLKNNKVRLSQPKHYAQMASYGKEFKTKHGLYVAVNKDDDDVYFEFVELDWNHALELENKAGDIIHSSFPPPRIAAQETHQKCKYCDFHGICWRNEPVEINCRSCKFAEPIDNAEWKCHKFEQTIPKDFLKIGCESHISIAVE